MLKINVGFDGYILYRMIKFTTMKGLFTDRVIERPLVVPPSDCVPVVPENVWVCAPYVITLELA